MAASEPEIFSIAYEVAPSVDAFDAPMEEILESAPG
jgi:hypothetical protein